MAKITVKLFDKKTQFNDVDVETINKAWGNTEYVLIYKDDEFTGIAQPKGGKSLEEWTTHFQKSFDAQAQAEEEQSQLDVIEANTSYLVMISE